ncbi:beta family protein [Actinotalea caeni]|uniref:beta family protein n=1 Tax=Actinotalea caeni TaxID=1348467 RepID=UPI00139183D7|nr:beta family protein [Actinotalea caeni]
MDAIPPTQYVPLLLTKQGERNGLKAVDPSTKAEITPLFVAHAIDWDHENDAPKKSVDDHLARLPGQLVDSWGTSPAMIDAGYLDGEIMATGEHPIEWITREARALGLPLVPAVSPDYSADYHDAVARVVARDSDGVCLRLSPSEWPGPMTSTAMEDLLRLLGVVPSEVHLVLDLGGELTTTTERLLSVTLSVLPTPMDWRSLIVAGGAMPAQLPLDTISRIPRQDWIIFNTVRHNGVRLPSYADYVVADPGPGTQIDPRFMSIKASIRYTADDVWVIARGGLFKGSGGRSLGARAVPVACQALVAEPEFTSGHCSCEDWVESVATSGAGGGGGMAWRQHATKHHLVLVTEQLASLP